MSSSALKYGISSLLQYLKSAYYSKKEHSEAHRLNQAVWGQARWGVARWGIVAEEPLTNQEIHANHIQLKNDLELISAGKGIVFITSNGKRFKLTVDDNGNLSVVRIS